MKTTWLRVGALTSALVAGAGCGRHPIRTSPALVAPTPPAHDAADAAGTSPETQRSNAATRRRSSTAPAERPGEFDVHPAPMIGVLDGPSPAAQPTSGTSVVVTTVPAKPSLPQRDSGSPPTPMHPLSSQPEDRGIAGAVLIAGALIGAIKLVPRWTDRD